MPDGFHFHDLRHTGNNLAAATGASTRDLMHRMGHASMRAALIYQHANSGRGRGIADSMDWRIVKQAERVGRAAKVKEVESAVKRAARKPAADGTKGATGPRMARKIK